MFKSPAVSLSSADYLGRGEPEKTQCSKSLFPFAPYLPSFPFSSAFLPLLSPFKPNLAHEEHCWCTTCRVCKGCFSKDLLHFLAVTLHPLAKKTHRVLPCLPPISHLPSSISHPHVLLHFLSLSSCPLHPEVGAAPGAVRVRHSCVPDTLLHSIRQRGRG